MQDQVSRLYNATVVEEILGSPQDEYYVSQCAAVLL
jgi:hypothetical protein